jgi:hypothetical protein
MVSEQSYTCISAKKWSLEVNSHLRMAIGHPFLAVGGLKEAPQAPVREHVTPFNPVGYLSVARGRHFRHLAGAQNESDLRSPGGASSYILVYTDVSLEWGTFLISEIYQWGAVFIICYFNG